jgi:hypothetical protein
MRSKKASAPATVGTVNEGQKLDQLGGSIGSKANQIQAQNQEFPRKSWRDMLPVHPAAEMFPLLSRDELLELGTDIKAHGLRTPIALWRSADGRDYLLDGRNRLDAVEAVGIKVVFDDRGLLKTGKKYLVNVVWYTEKPSHDPYRIAISLNARRRHLTAEQKREVIGKLLQAKPELSDRAAAKMVGVDHKTVGSVRATCNGEIPHKPDRTEASGRKARGRKPKPSTAAEIQQLRNIEPLADSSDDEICRVWDEFCRAWVTAPKAEKLEFIREHWKELCVLAVGLGLAAPVEAVAS